MKKLLLLLLLTSIGYSQQPTTTAPLMNWNSQYVNGTAPGYWPTAGTGRNLLISSGTSFCAGVVVNYAGGTLALPASSTSYIFLDATNACAVTSNTSGFTNSYIPIAIVTTTSTITNITDVRNSFSGAAAAFLSSSLQKSSNLSDVASTTSAATNIGSFISSNMTNCGLAGYLWAPASGYCISPSILNNRGVWAPTTLYAVNDFYTNSNTGYIVYSSYTSGGTFGSTDTTHASIFVAAINLGITNTFTAAQIISGSSSDAFGSTGLKVQGPGVGSTMGILINNTATSGLSYAWHSTSSGNGNGAGVLALDDVTNSVNVAFFANAGSTIRSNLTVAKTLTVNTSTSDGFGATALKIISTGNGSSTTGLLISNTATGGIVYAIHGTSSANSEGAGLLSIDDVTNNANVAYFSRAGISLMAATTATTSTTDGYGATALKVISTGNTSTTTGILLNNTATGGIAYAIHSTSNGSAVGGGMFSIDDVTDQLNIAYFSHTGIVFQAPLSITTGPITVDTTGLATFASIFRFTSRCSSSNKKPIGFLWHPTSTYQKYSTHHILINLSCIWRLLGCWNRRIKLRSKLWRWWYLLC